MDIPPYKFSSDSLSFSYWPMLKNNMSCIQIFKIDELSSDFFQDTVFLQQFMGKFTRNRVDSPEYAKNPDQDFFATYFRRVALTYMEIETYRFSGSTRRTIADGWTKSHFTLFLNVFFSKKVRRFPTPSLRLYAKTGGVQRLQ